MSLTDFPPLPDLPGAASARPSRALTPQQKAAVVVRLLQAEGAEVPLSRLPDHLQIQLLREMGGMRALDADTVASIVDEFADSVDAIALSFPDGMPGALGLVGRALSASAAQKARDEAGVDYDGDPWERLGEMPPERLAPVLARESVEVGAVILTSLPVAQAAACLGQLSGPDARRISYAVGQIADTPPDVVRRIGVAVAKELAVSTASADAEPTAKIGAILNQSKSMVRDDVLAGLDEEDRAFAEEVRKAIFTFDNIPARVAERDVPKILRDVDQARLIIAIAGASEKERPAADYLLANMSQRMADSLREEAKEKTNLTRDDVEAAMQDVVTVIRRLEADGELVLRSGKPAAAPAIG